MLGHPYLSAHRLYVPKHPILTSGVVKHIPSDRRDLFEGFCIRVHWQIQPLWRLGTPSVASGG